MFLDLGKFFLPDKNYPKKLNPEGLSRLRLFKVSNQSAKATKVGNLV
jgi:hypothetical protein